MTEQLQFYLFGGLSIQVGQRWDCGEDVVNNTSSNGPAVMPNIVTRQNVTQFSDWAVGVSVGPTAVTIQSFSAAAPSLPMTPLLLGLLLLFLLSARMVLYRRRHFRE